MRNLFIAALAAVTLANVVVTTSEAATEVRDHRHPVATDVRDHRHSPPPVAANGQGGVTVTSRPRPRKEKACLLGLVCTSNQTVVGVVSKSIDSAVPFPR